MDRSRGPSTQTASSSIAPPWSRGIFFIDRYRSRKMHALKDRQNGKTRLSTCREPHLGAQRPRTICKQGSPQSKGMGNPMGHETRTRMLTRELPNT